MQQQLGMIQEKMTIFNPVAKKLIIKLSMGTKTTSNKPSTKFSNFLNSNEKEKFFNPAAELCFEPSNELFVVELATKIF